MNDLLKILNSITGKRALVVGDLMMDEFVWGKVGRISPEAPVVVVEVEKETYAPGGAANVASNIQSLGGKACVVGVIGNDEIGIRLTATLADLGADISGLVTDPSRPTTNKSRIIAHNQQVVRIDKEDRKKLPQNIVKEITVKFEEKVADVDVVIFSDYNKGVAVRRITEALFKFAGLHRKPVVVNIKPANVRQFVNATILSMNQSEAEMVTGISMKSDEALKRGAKRIMNSVHPKNILITCGKEGIRLFDAKVNMKSIPAHQVEVYDVAGAGDTVVSMLALSLAAGASPEQAAILANCGGGSAVRRVGVAAITREEVESILLGS